MANENQDQYGNYRPGLQPGDSLPGGFGRLRKGNGVPPSSLGNNGDLYVDLSTGDVYQKTFNAWNVISGGGGGGTVQVYRGAVTNPNGTVTPSATNQPAIYYRDAGGINSLWRWSVANQAWEEIISP